MIATRKYSVGYNCCAQNKCENLKLKISVIRIVDVSIQIYE